MLARSEDDIGEAPTSPPEPISDSEAKKSGADEAPARTRQTNYGRAAAKRRTAPAVARRRERRTLRLVVGDRLGRLRVDGVNNAAATRRPTASLAPQPATTLDAGGNVDRYVFNAAACVFGLVVNERDSTQARGLERLRSFML
jgi:hypothetical protein